MVELQVVTPTPRLVLQLAQRMRPADVAEVRATAAVGPRRALERSIAASQLARALLIRNEVAAMYGYAPVGPDTAAVWLLTARVVDRYPVTFMRLCRQTIAALLEQWPALTNAVDARHVRALAWARHLGAEVAPARPYGTAQLPFHQVTWRRKAAVH